jgi:Flp pilus assembly protein TadB
MSEPTTTERRVTPDRRAAPDRREANRSAAGQLVAAFWVADAMILGLIIFFAVVGGAVQSAAVRIVAIVCAVLLAVHSLIRHRRRHEATLSLGERRARERRGF